MHILFVNTPNITLSSKNTTFCVVPVLLQSESETIFDSLSGSRVDGTFHTLASVQFLVQSRQMDSEDSSGSNSKRSHYTIVDEGAGVLLFLVLRV